jgi:hypothetical protein
MCGRYTLTIGKSTIEKRFGGRFYIARLPKIRALRTSRRAQGPEPKRHLLFFDAALPRQNGGRCAECITHERGPRPINRFLHVSLRGHMRPILDDACDAIGADADEDVRPVIDLHNARLPK